MDSAPKCYACSLALPPYEYPEVDIPIERPFEEWIERKDGSLDRLIEIILERRNGAKAKQDSAE